MARLWSSGFELNSTTANMEYTANVGSAVLIDSTTKRSGSYSFKAYTDSTAGAARSGFIYQFAASAADNHVFLRMYVYITAATFTAATLPSILTLDDGTTVRASIRLDTDLTLQLFNASTQVGSASSALSLNTWHRIELEYDSTQSAGSDVLTGRLDGSDFATSTAQTLASISRFSMGGLTLTDTGSITFYIDDVAINDTTGSFQTSWPGSGQIIHLRPSAAGDNAGWTREGADSGANWSQVDEVTPNDTTDAVVSASAVTDDYNVDDTPAALNSTSTINVVAVGHRSKMTDGGINSTVVLRIKASASGTTEESAALTIANATYNTNATAAPRNYQLTLYDLPGASTTAWTKTDLDAAQIGVKTAGSPDSTAHVTAVWALVDFTPGVVSTTKTLAALGVG